MYIISGEIVSGDQERLKIYFNFTCTIPNKRDLSEIFSYFVILNAISPCKQNRAKT